MPHDYITTIALLVQFILPQNTIYYNPKIGGLYVQIF